MYYDDPYNPTLENEYDVVPSRADMMSVADSDSVTVNSRILKIRKLTDDLKNEDKGYCKIKRMGLNSTNPYAMTSIEIYSGSSMPGCAIRNAITGVRFPHYKVGTRDEFMFFKVGIATGEKGLRGNSTFFFDNPEQYERHMHCKLDTTTKSEWAERNRQEILIRNSKE